MKWYYIPKNNPKIRFLLQDVDHILPPKDEIFACRVKDKGWGLGRILSSSHFSWILSPSFGDVNAFSADYFPVSVNGKWGYANTEGEFILNPTWDYARSFSENYAVVLKDGKWGFIKKNGEWFIPAKSDDLRSYSDGVAVGRLKNTWFVVDKEKKTLSTPNVSFLKSFSEGLAACNIGGDFVHAQLVMGGKWGFVNKEGELAIPNIFSWLGSFCDGKAPYYKEEENEWGFVYSNGITKIISGVDGIRSHKGEEMLIDKNNFWGISHIRGVEIIPCVYDVLEFFLDEGYLAGEEE